MFENIIINLKASTSGLGGWYNETRKLNQSLSNINKDANRTAVGIAKLGGSFKGLNQVIGVGKIMLLGSAISKTIQSAMDMTETVNLFSVAMGDTAVETNKTVKQMSTLYGLDSTNLQNSIGTFSLLARSMGMTTTQSSTLSTNMAKLAVDISSLTNVPIQQVMADLKSGLVGQSETVYKYGMDVTEAGIKQEAMRQGITKSVREMGQGEKMALRYSAMIHQSGLAQTDFARTIDTPANQMRILGERFITLGRSIGGMFIPMLSAVLPWLNAFVMILTDVANAIAKFFGFKPPEVTNGVASAIGGIGDEADSATDKVGGTEKALKKLKNATMGFDQLNILPDQTSTPKSGGAGGGGTSTLPDFKLPSYDNAMDGIVSKADEVKKKLLAIFSNSDGLFDPLVKAINRFGEAFAPIKDKALAGLKWVYDNVLVPIAKWTITDALPAFFNLLSGALDVLNPLLTTMNPLGQWLWNEFLLPLGEWTGGVVVDTINGIADTLSRIGQWMSDNQQLVIDVTNTVIGFMLAWEVTKLLAFIETSGGVVGAFNNISGAIKKMLQLKWIDISTTIGANVLYAVDCVKSLAKMTAEMVVQAGQWVKNTALKIVDKAETLYLMALYGIDFVKNLAKMTAEMVIQGAKWVWLTGLKIADAIAQGVMTAGLILWNATVVVASAVTTAFGAVLAFLTSPIGIVILAIAGLIAIGILLYKNWDTVKAVGLACFNAVVGFVNKYFPTISETISGVVNSVKTIFNGLINFITGVFTGNWRKAFQGLSDIFKGIFDGLWTIAKIPINMVIDGINILIGGLNKLKFDLPDFLGGGHFGINIPKIPHLAKGGMLTTGSLFEAGEGGKAEMIGSHNGKTTVMPLENTDFVQAMYEAVFGAVSDAMKKDGGSGDLVLKVGSTEFGRVAISSINKVTKQEGRLALDI